MAPKKKSLADELADLFNPAPTKGARDGSDGPVELPLLPPSAAACRRLAAGAACSSTCRCCTCSYLIAVLLATRPSRVRPRSRCIWGRASAGGER